MEPDRSALNEHQARRLLVTCQHIDKLLSDIEYTLGESESKMAFPRHISDIAPAQRRTIEDYISRIRAQMIRVLDGQGIPRGAPSIPTSWSIHVTLIAIDIAIDELRPKGMRGHGEVPQDVAIELNGIVGELHSIIARLDRYITEDAAQDLRSRLCRLEQEGNDLNLLAAIERIVADRGMVEFRGAIRSILDRAEDRTFEIAVFGRVSSGKSSLLNAVLCTGILPAGVTPVTSVPTRITYGETPAMTVSFTDAAPRSFDIAALGDYATEQQNPGNTKHVARIVIRIPSPCLRDGITFVDTPGLGSLATKGAAETLAYLPACDLGVVLIDSGSTLTSEDIHTILTLAEAAVPVQVLLSKADLLSPSDCGEMISYVKEHIAIESGLDLTVHPVSVLQSRQRLLDEWFGRQILPLYSRSQELKDASLQRKIGTLRESVIAALRIRLRRHRQAATATPESVRAVEARLRQSLGSIETARLAAERELEGVADIIGEISWETAARLTEVSPQEAEQSSIALLRSSTFQIMRQRVQNLQAMIEELAVGLQRSLVRSAEDLDMTQMPEKEEFQKLIRGLPVFEPGNLTVTHLPTTRSTRFGRRPTQQQLADQIRRQLVKGPLEDALVSYTRGLKEWLTIVTGDFTRTFELYAEQYRVHADQVLHTGEVSTEEAQGLEHDIRSLESMEGGVWRCKEAKREGI